MKRLAFICVIGLTCCLFILIESIKGLLYTEHRMMTKWNHHSIKREAEQMPVINHRKTANIWNAE